MNRTYQSTPEELERRDRWIQENLLGAAEPPFSLNVGGRKRKLAEEGVRKTVRRERLDRMRTKYAVVFDAGDGLEIECDAVLYSKYAACEWKLSLRNLSQTDSETISDFYAADTLLFRGCGNLPVLTHYDGDNCVRTGYRPSDYIFYAGYEKKYRCFGGRPTNMEFPYYLLKVENGGCFFVLSWQGQWETAFAPVSGGLRVRGRQMNLSCRLHPGESVVSPMALLYFFDGSDGDRITNLWRHWFIECNMPHPNGKLIPPFYINYPGKIFYEMVNADEQKLFDYIDRYAGHGIKFDYLWLDAGWYDLQGTGEWHKTGTWKCDKKRFPHGIRAISDYALQKVGAKTMLWFEPERVNRGTEIFETHPEWCLPCRKYEELYRKSPDELRAGSRLLNLGNPDALDFIVKRIDSILNREGIRIYREDFNLEPYDCWTENDEEGRAGILENHYCSGFLRFFDRLLADNPGLFIDNCSSGGRRNDLETMRRSIPLHKTDYDPGDLTAKHGFHHSLFHWFPFFGSYNMPGDQSDIYYQRSSLLLSFSGCENVFKSNFDFRLLDRWMQEWRENASCLYGDYYPVTPYSIDDKSWIGWQFDLPEEDDLGYLKEGRSSHQAGEGMLQIFMHGDAPYRSAQIRLKGLLPSRIYDVKDYNAGTATGYTGETLMELGLTVRMRRSPDSALYHYRLRPIIK